MSSAVYDSDTNILLQVFENQFKRRYHEHEGEHIHIFKDMKEKLNDDGLGRGFYNCLKSVSDIYDITVVTGWAF